MKTALSVLIIGLLAGCASVGPQEMAQRDKQVDSAYMAAIESAAKSRGVQVIWLQYPTRKAEVASN